MPYITDEQQRRIINRIKAMQAVLTDAMSYTSINHEDFELDRVRDEIDRLGRDTVELKGVLDEVEGGI